MGTVLFLVFAWLVLLAFIASIETWWYNYVSPIDWYYRELRTDPKAGVWYYGTPEAARRRERV